MLHHVFFYHLKLSQAVCCHVAVKQSSSLRSLSSSLCYIYQEIKMNYQDCKMNHKDFISLLHTQTVDKSNVGSIIMASAEDEDAFAHI